MPDSSPRPQWRFVSHPFSEGRRMGVHGLRRLASCRRDTHPLAEGGGVVQRCVPAGPRSTIAANRSHAHVEAAALEAIRSCLAPLYNNPPRAADARAAEGVEGPAPPAARFVQFGCDNLHTTRRLKSGRCDSLPAPRSDTRGVDAGLAARGYAARGPSWPRSPARWATGRRDACAPWLPGQKSPRHRPQPKQTGDRNRNPMGRSTAMVFGSEGRIAVQQAAKRRDLVLALWDSSKHRPSPSPDDRRCAG